MDLLDVIVCDGCGSQIDVLKLDQHKCKRMQPPDAWLARNLHPFLRAFEVRILLRLNALSVLMQARKARNRKELVVLLSASWTRRKTENCKSQPNELASKPRRLQSWLSMTRTMKTRSWI